MFLLASLAGHATLLVPLSAYTPALLDDSELEADTVMLSISVVSHAEQKSHQRRVVNTPYQPLDNVGLPNRQTPVTAQQDDSLAATARSAPKQSMLAKTGPARSASQRLRQPPPRPVEQTVETPPSVEPVQDSQRAAVEVTRRRQQIAEERYLTELLNAIAQHRFYPARARSKGQQGRVEVNLTILRSGEFKSIAVSKPSSYRTLNKASTRTLNRLRRFKPFPSDIDRDSWRISIPFRYVLSAGNDSRS